MVMPYVQISCNGYKKLEVFMENLAIHLYKYGTPTRVSFLTSDFGILRATCTEYVDVIDVFLLEMCTNVVWVRPVFSSVNTACVYQLGIVLAMVHLPRCL